MKAKQRMKLTNQVRMAVERCGQTRYQIAKATGISEATLCRFASGERFISPTALDTLGAYLGLSVTIRKPKKKGGR